MTIDRPNPTQTDALRSLWKEAFGDTDAFLDAFWTTAFDPQRCRCVHIKGKPVAALYWLDCSCAGRNLAYLYAVATAKEYRGQGLCKTLMENTHAHLKNLGYAGVVLVPGSEALFSMYAGMGYACFGGMDSVTGVWGLEPVTFHTVERSTYGALRRRLLPEDAVIQERENLAFLETQAEFYEGPDFLLAARLEGRTLQGIEFLGNTRTIPGILRSLDCEHGTFRVPGKSPFAMYHPLEMETDFLPGYFGLAFD